MKRNKKSLETGNTDLSINRSYGIDMHYNELYATITFQFAYWIKILSRRQYLCAKSMSYAQILCLSLLVEEDLAPLSSKAEANHLG